MSFERVRPHDEDLFVNTFNKQDSLQPLVPYPRIGRPIKYVYIESKYGHDIRVQVPVRADGTTVFDEDVRLSSDEVADFMRQSISPGSHKILPEYPHPVTILPGERAFFNIQEDSIGTKSLTARFYVLGDHYKNGIGQMISIDDSWSIQRDENGNIVYDQNGEIIKEEETIVFLSMSYTPFEPGVIKKKIVRTDSPNNEFKKTIDAFDSDTNREIFYSSSIEMIIENGQSISTQTTLAAD